jgi:hypothetical protein
MGLRDDSMNQARLHNERGASEFADKIKGIKDSLKYRVPAAVDRWARNVGTTVSDVRIGEPETNAMGTHGWVKVEWEADGLRFRGVLHTASADSLDPKILIDGREYPAITKLQIGQALMGTARLGDYGQDNLY